MTRRSDWVTPGPPLRGILSPPCIHVRAAQQLSERPNRVSTYRYINHIDDVVCKLRREVSREVVTSTLHEHQLAPELRLENLQRAHVRRYVFADSGVRATAGLNGGDALGGKSLITDEELLVFAREDVICDGG